MHMPACKRNNNYSKKKMHKYSSESTACSFVAETSPLGLKGWSGLGLMEQATSTTFLGFVRWQIEK